MAREGRRPGCAAISLGRDEPLLATASRVRRWLVIEQPGPWGREALLDSRLDELIARTVSSRARRWQVRVVLARRPGWTTGEVRRVYLARTDRTHGWIEQVDVEDPQQLTHIDLSVFGAGEAPGLGEPGPASVHLVCTNGRHDACCADLGRPVVRALRQAGSPEVWESSHIGGDRFAANLVCLPSGIYYGRVPPGGAARLVADHGRGVLDLDHYRGRSCFSPLVQAAEIFTRLELGERRLDALRVVRATRLGADGTAIEVDHDGRRVEARVVRERGDPQLLTCTADGPAAPWRYRLVGMRTVSG